VFDPVDCFVRVSFAGVKIYSISKQDLQDSLLDSALRHGRRNAAAVFENLKIFDSVSIARQIGDMIWGILFEATSSGLL